MNNKKIEELELDLIEIQAYRDLQDESFCFDVINEIKKENKFSEDAYYKIIENNIIEKLEYEESKKLIKKMNNI